METDTKSLNKELYSVMYDYEVKIREYLYNSSIKDLIYLNTLNEIINDAEISFILDKLFLVQQDLSNIIPITSNMTPERVISELENQLKRKKAINRIRRCNEIRRILDLKEEVLKMEESKTKQKI